MRRVRCAMALPALHLALIFLCLGKSSIDIFRDVTYLLNSYLYMSAIVCYFSYIMLA
jgi:hypothetical protein